MVRVLLSGRAYVSWEVFTVVSPGIVKGVRIKGVIIMLIVTGKSSSGKSAIKEALVKSGMQVVIPYTTCTIQVDKVEGVDYHLISKKGFNDKLTDGSFLALRVDSSKRDEEIFYGYAVEEIRSKNSVAEVSLAEVNQLKQLVSDSVVCYIDVDDKITKKRMVQQGYIEDKIKHIVNKDKAAFSRISKSIDFMVVNNIDMKPELLADIVRYAYSRYIKSTGRIAV